MVHSGEGAVHVVEGVDAAPLVGVLDDVELGPEVGVLGQRPDGVDEVDGREWGREFKRESRATNSG